MCGIAGILTKTDRTRESLNRVTQAMTECIRHRGPDDSGLWNEPESGVGLGFRRLSIIDLSTLGHQPMQSQSGRYTLVYNGEVYNHGDLRKTLLTEGWRFRGHSDTEVIVAAFERWGIDEAVRRFIGMFAIAVWDSQSHELSLIRDRMGIKPLFYSHSPGVFTFGSELKTLRAVPGFDATLDQDALSSYLRYLYVPAPLTIYKQARKLLPGHILTVGQGASSIPEPRPYWSLETAYQNGLDHQFDGSDAEAVELLDRLLSNAVKLRMQADVPLGALLSGGIDSSTVVALMQANMQSATRTFSIGFPGTIHDESAHAAEIAKRLGTNHTSMAVTAEDALNVVPLLPDMFDEPLGDPSQIPTYLVCKLARQEVTVALSGDGGDELFAGYDRYLQGERMIPGLERIPKVVRRGAAAVVSAASTRFWDRTYEHVTALMPALESHRLAGQKIKKLGHLLRHDAGNEMYRTLLSAWQQPEDVLTGPARRPDPILKQLDSAGELPLLDRMMFVDQQTYLAEDLLAKVDRASMAVSLEARVPLLDHRVVEFSWTLPRRMKIREQRGKWLLRQVLYRYVEPRLVDRPKVGFTVPVAQWLRGPLRSWSEDLLLGESTGSQPSALKLEHVRKQLAQFQGGADELALPIWTAVMFEAWRRRWLN